MKDPFDELAETARARRIEVQDGCDASSVARGISMMLSSASPSTIASKASRCAKRGVRDRESAEESERPSRRPR